MVSRSSAGNKEEEEVGGDSEGSSLDIWELLLTIHKRREMEVAAWVYCRAGRGAWDVGEKQGVNCRSVDIARKEGKTRRRHPEALLRRLGLGEQGEWRRARKLYPWEGSAPYNSYGNNIKGNSRRVRPLLCKSWREKRMNGQVETGDPELLGLQGTVVCGA